MRIARFIAQDQIHYGFLEDGSSRIIGLKGDPLFNPVEPSGLRFELGEVKLLSPVIPRSKVACVGKNYAEHAAEMGTAVPAEPTVFLKPNTSVIGPDDPIVMPRWAGRIDHEVELAAVIKTLTKDVPADKIADHILGWTIANDVTARDIQAKDGQWTRAKSFDTSCPLGPWVVVDPDLQLDNLELTATVDGQVRQHANTADMIYSALETVAYLSTCFTLLPGDVVLTGTPAGIGPVEPGQSITCEISGIGYLSNQLVKR